MRSLAQATIRGRSISNWSAGKMLNQRSNCATRGNRRFEHASVFGINIPLFKIQGVFSHKSDASKDESLKKKKTRIFRSETEGLDSGRMHRGDIKWGLPTIKHSCTQNPLKIRADGPLAERGSWLLMLRVPEQLTGTQSGFFGVKLLRETAIFILLGFSVGGRGGDCRTWWKI